MYGLSCGPDDSDPGDSCYASEIDRSCHASSDKSRPGAPSARSATPMVQVDHRLAGSCPRLRVLQSEQGRVFTLAPLDRTLGISNPFTPRADVEPAIAEAGVGQRK